MSKRKEEEPSLNFNLTTKNNPSRKDFVKKNSNANVRQKAIQTQFVPGIYTQHHPSQCYQTLDSQPIHLKKAKYSTVKTG